MNTTKKKRFNASNLVVLAMFTALSYVAVCVFHIKVTFLTFDIKDAFIAVTGMLYGPLSAIAISVVVSLIEMFTISETYFYGFIMNVLSSVAFTAVASLVYKYKRNLLGAVLGLISGVFSVTATMMLFNLLVTPFYMGTTMSAVAKLIPTLLLPFNFIKALLNASLVMIIYKPIVTALRRAGAIKKSSVSTEGYKFDKKSALTMLISALIMAGSLVIVFVVMGGKLGWGFEIRTKDIDRLIVFLLSMVPIIELRGAIPVGLAFELPLWETLLLSISGNIVIIPFVIILFNKILHLMREVKFTAKIADWLEKRAIKNSRKIENWVFVGLMLFVAVPLPGTGAWTASMAAGLMQMKARKASIPIAIGVIIAAAIVTLVTYGVIKIFT